MMRATLKANARLVAGILAALLFAAVLRTSPAIAAAADPQTIIRQTTDGVIAILANTNLSADEKRAWIEELVDQTFDFRTVSRLVLARNWRRLTAAEQDAFVSEFRRHLSMTYGRGVENYHGEKVAIIGVRKEPRGDRTVKTAVARPNAEDIHVDYRLRRGKDGWHIIDVIVEGVSLIANYRAQFRDLARKGGPAKIIKLLREKNEKGEPLKS